MTSVPQLVGSENIPIERFFDLVFNNMEHTDGRVLLSRDVDPVKYKPCITVNRTGNFLFEGVLDILATVTREGVQELTLHSKELEVESCTYAPAGESLVDGKTPAATAHKIVYDLNLSTVTFVFKEAFKPGDAVFGIKYIGRHNNQMAGFYRSEYPGVDGQPRIMLSTQFESLDARRCFPCIDEPGRKAVFHPTLIFDDEGGKMIALSNMPVESDTRIDDVYRKVVFGESPKMSTYLLAFAVCDFEYVEDYSQHGVKIRVYTPIGKTESGKFALSVAVKVLDFFDDVFAEPYPLPKLDMIAVPEFAMGAMENWGLVTYREVDLLIDEKKASNSQKQRVATVVAHELAHQWFGNLVTMAWWNGLWLNEGFATFMADFCLDSLFPDWALFDQFVNGCQAIAMRLDALVSSHPIQVPIAHAEEVEQVFDHISYYKGASVVRLVHSFLGPDWFKEGLRKYMKKYKYGNTETADLWQAWEDVSGLPVKAVMASWTEQMGFPLVTVQKMEWAADYSNCKLTLEQKWFIADGSEPNGSEEKLWSIPLQAIVHDKLVSLGVMNTKVHEVTVDTPGAAGPQLIKLNGEQHVPLRVNYAPVYDQVAPLLSDAILTRKICPADRIGLLLDSFALTKAGKQDPGALVSLLRSYKDENSMPVVAAMEEVLSSINGILKSDDASELFNGYVKFAKEIVKGPTEAVGWEPRDTDGHLTILLRSALIRMQAMFMSDDAEVFEKAKSRFDAFVADPENGYEKLPSDIKTTVFKIVLKNCSGRETYDKCKELLKRASNNKEKVDVYLALGYVQSMETKLETLDWCTTPGNIKLQDFFYPIAGVADSSAEGRKLTWDYLQKNFDRIVAMVSTASPSLLSAVVSNSCQGFASEEKASEIEEFFEKHKQTEPVCQITRKLDQIVEHTRANAKLLNSIKNSTQFSLELSQ